MSNYKLTDAKNIFPTYGEALKYERERRSKKQGGLAKELGINQSELSRWENKDMVPLEHNQEKIKQVLNIIITPVKDGWVVIDAQEGEKENLTHTGDRFNEEGVRFRLIDTVDDLEQEPSLDDLPALVRLRDKLDRKIQELVNKKRS